MQPGDWSDFQGVDQDEIGPVEINGKEKEVCAGCYEDNPVLW